MIKELKSTISIKEFSSIDEVPENHINLLQRAMESREQAYAPYSHFLVGAAVLLEDGNIVVGNNQENAAYPSGLCAERVAIYSAGAQFPDLKMEAIAISCRNKKKETSTPKSSCGACRQAMLEYELKQDQDITIYFTGEKGAVWQVNSIKELLPLFFPPEAL